MTRRFDDFTQKVHDHFRIKAEQNPDQWIDRETAIIDLQNLIAPGEASRISANIHPDHHESLDDTQRIRRGRRIKLVNTMTSLQRGGHLYISIDGNKTLYKYRDKEKEGKAPELVPQRKRSTAVTVTPVESVPVAQAVQAMRFRQVTKSDVAHQFHITDVLINGQPCIRMQFEDITLELTASATDALCDRLASQLVYARGTAMALQQVDNPIS